jgi:hypothetical protein
MTLLFVVAVQSDLEEKEKDYEQHRHRGESRGGDSLL